MNILNLPDWNVTSLVESTNIEVTATYTPQPRGCPICGAAGQFRKFGFQAQRVKDVPVDGLPVVITLRRQRYRCRSCGQTFSQYVAELGEVRTMTKRLVQYIQEQAAERPYTHVAKETGIVEGTIRNLMRGTGQGQKKRGRPRAKGGPG